MMANAPLPLIISGIFSVFGGFGSLFWPILSLMLIS
jgi:hypothetical protein